MIVQKFTTFESDDARREFDRAARLAVAGELVAAITHDLRQPLTALEMNVAAALRLLDLSAVAAPADRAARIADAVAALRDALGEQQRMREALQVLQDLSASREPTFGSLDVEAMVKETVRLVSTEAFARHIPIDVRADANVPRINADGTLLRQALLNVLLDALHATSESGNQNGPLAVDVRPAENSVEIVVTHFAPGDRASGSSLALARAVADAHGANLTITGDPGSTVSVVTRWPVLNGPRHDIAVTGERRVDD